MAVKPFSATSQILASLQASTGPHALRKLEEAEQKKPGAKIRTYAVNYRLDGKVNSARGAYDKRRDALLALINVLDPKPWHYATSSWEIKSWLTTAQLKQRLSAPLDERIDVLAVTPIGRTEMFGDPRKLEN